MAPETGSDRPATDWRPTVAWILAATLAALALVGWEVGSPTLKSLLPGSVAMNPMTAIGLLLASFAMAAGHNGRSSRWRFASRVAAVVVVLIGALKLLAVLGAPLPEFDRLLLRSQLVAEPTPNQMAPNTALAMMLLGVALWTNDLRVAGSMRLAQVPFGLVGVLGIVTVVGYCYRATGLIGFAGHIPMAPNTAVAFVALALGGLVGHHEHGLARLTASQSPGGFVARGLLPASVLVPVVCGWLFLPRDAAPAGHQLGITALAVSSLLGAMVWLAALRLERADLERKRIEDQLRQALVRQNRLFDSDLIGVVTLDPRRRIVEANRAFLEMLGYGVEDLPIPMARISVPGQRGLDALAAREVLGRGTATPYQKDLIRRDGSRVPVIAGVASVPGTGQAIAFGLDLTAQKRVEAELEAFTYSVSHDLRAPLRHISGFADMLQRSHADQLDDAGRRRLRVIVESATRMGNLIDDLLSFSRMSRAEMQRVRVDLGVLVDGARRELAPEIAGRDIDWRIAPLPDVMGDPAMLRLVFMNLLSNAIKYSSTRERSLVEVGAVSGPGEEPVIRVRDNGVGFDPRYADKLFGVFQRLHRQDEFPGTGIGLANVRRIVHRHGGRVWAESVPDQGAAFYVALSAVPGEAQALAHAA